MPCYKKYVILGTKNKHYITNPSFITSSPKHHKRKEKSTPYQNWKSPATSVHKLSQINSCISLQISPTPSPRVSPYWHSQTISGSSNIHITFSQRTMVAQSNRCYSAASKHISLPYMPYAVISVHPIVMSAVFDVQKGRPTIAYAAGF